MHETLGTTRVQRKNMSMECGPLSQLRPTGGEGKNVNEAAIGWDQFDLWHYSPELGTEGFIDYPHVTIQLALG